MTKFVTFYNLCPIPDRKDFLGTASDFEDGNVITTLSKNIIMVIKISSQKQIRSWSVLEKLSSKVVFDPRSQKYVGVFANRALRCWDASTTDINKCKKIKFHKSIAELINVGNEDTLVLYSDGSFQLLADAIEARKNDVGAAATSAPANRTLSNIQITNFAGRQMLTFFEKDNASGELHLVRHLLNENVESMRFRITRDAIKLAAYAVIEADECPALLTIWADKRMFILPLNDNVMPEKSPGNFVSMFGNLKVDRYIAVLGITKHFIAIYGANSAQEGASLLLYNTQFKVVKAKQFFKVFFDHTRLWSAKDHILLGMGQHLSVVAYRMSKDVLLSELIGTQTNNELKTAIEVDNINEEEYLQEAIKYQSTGEGILNSVEQQAAAAYAEADGKVIAFESVTQFDKQLHELAQLQLQVDVVEVETALEDFEISLMSNGNDVGFATKEINIIARQLERCGASEHEITEKLLTILIKANAMQDIAFCLRRYSNISEKMLAKALGYVLGELKPNAAETESNVFLTNGSIHQEQQQKLTESATEFPLVDILAVEHLPKCSNLQAMDVLNCLLSCAFDAVSIAVHIRREIDYNKVILLMDHMYALLTSNASEYELEQRHTAAASIGDNLELQVLRWFGVILNSHFQKLALSKDVYLVELLYKWHQLFALYKKEIEELQEVAALLYNIVERKKISKEKNYSKWYSIEEVVLF